MTDIFSELWLTKSLGSVLMMLSIAFVVATLGAGMVLKDVREALAFAPVVMVVAGSVVAIVLSLGQSSAMSSQDMRSGEQVAAYIEKIAKEDAKSVQCIVDTIEVENLEFNRSTIHRAHKDCQARNTKAQIAQEVRSLLESASPN